MQNPKTQQPDYEFSYSEFEFSRPYSSKSSIWTHKYLLLGRINSPRSFGLQQL